MQHSLGGCTVLAVYEVQRGREFRSMAVTYLQAASVPVDLEFKGNFFFRFPLFSGALQILHLKLQ